MGGFFLLCAQGRFSKKETPLTPIQLVIVTFTHCRLSKLKKL